MAEFQLPRIKVCGLTTTADVAHALHAGADALGFVFHRTSPRHREPEAIAALVAAAARRATTVLVLVDVDVRRARELARRTGVDALQLCGAERAADFADLNVPILRRIGVDASGAAALDDFAAVARGFVLDAPHAPGGTGRTVDFERAAELAGRAPCLLAGGLNHANVARAVAAVRPVGVDASSRLEARAARKDPRRVDAFAQRAALALNSCGSRRFPSPLATNPETAA